MDSWPAGRRDADLESQFVQFAMLDSRRHHAADDDEWRGTEYLVRLAAGSSLQCQSVNVDNRSMLIFELPGCIIILLRLRHVRVSIDSHSSLP